LDQLQKTATENEDDLNYKPSMFLFIIFCGFVCLAVESSSSPVIGILTQPSGDSSNNTEIAASYVKWVEAGGARSIPIPYDASTELVEDIFSRINGILFTGGGSDLPASAVDIWRLVQKANRQQDFFPLWGTCLGFEYLLKLASGDAEILDSGYQAENISLALYQVQQRQLYKNPRLFELVQGGNITMNNHNQGIDPERFLQTPSLTKYWEITSMNFDLQGRPFVSTIEPWQNQRFPVYGVQYHPEKNTFEYGTYPHTNIPYEAIDHSPAGITMSLELASFFVNLARRNQENGKHEYSGEFPLISSYPVKQGLKFEQLFIIPPATELGPKETNSAQSEHRNKS
jgi:gamma-glutamyl hydrolase